MLQTRQAPTGSHLRLDGEGLRLAGTMPTWQQRFMPTYAIELDRFIQAVRTGAPGDLPSLTDGLAAQQIADAARRSAREKCVVALSPPS